MNTHRPRQNNKKTGSKRKKQQTLSKKKKKKNKDLRDKMNLGRKLWKN